MYKVDDYVVSDNAAQAIFFLLAVKLNKFLSENMKFSWIFTKTKTMGLFISYVTMKLGGEKLNTLITIATKQSKFCVL